MPIKSSTARPWHAPEIKDLLPMCQFCQKWARFKLKRLHATSNGLLYTDTYVQALMRVQYLVKITHEQSVQISVNPSIPGSYRLCLYLKRSPKRIRQKFWNKHIWYALTKIIVFYITFLFLELSFWDFWILGTNSDNIPRVRSDKLFLAWWGALKSSLGCH